MTEIELEKRLKDLRARGNTIFPMLENAKYFLRTWTKAGKNDVRLELIRGYGLNETIKYHLVEIDNAENFFSEINVAKSIVNVKINTKPISLKYSLQMSETTDNNIAALRTHLFGAIVKLEGGIMKHEEAKAMASLAQTIINSAKLELDYKRMIEKTPDIKMLNS